MSCHTGAYPLRPSLLASLSGLSFGFGPFDQVIHHLISLSLSRGRTYIDQPSPCHVSSVSGTAPISIGHLLVSLSLCFRDRTYIDQSSSCQFGFLSLGPHLYRSVIFLSVWVYVFGIVLIYIDHLFVSSVWVLQNHTYIDWSFSCQFVFSSSWDRTYIDWSSSYQFSSIWVFRDRTYIDLSLILSVCV